jgi:hypothetical protein
MSLETVASGSSQGNDIQLWSTDASRWGESAQDKAVEGSTKRQKTGVATVEPLGILKSTVGIQTLKWATPDSLIAAGLDH